MSSKHSLYKLLIAPHSSDPNTRNQELVLNWLLVGSLVLALAAFVNTLFSFAVLGDHYLLIRLVAIVGLFGLFAGLLWLSRRRQQQIVPSIVLVTIFFGSAFSVVYLWGILAPDGILLFSLVIVMAGILLNARFSLYMALLTIVALSGVEYAKSHHYLHPNLAWEQRPSSFTDVVSFAAILGILALISWLFNQQMELALTRAQRSEKALERQRDRLEITVEQRTRALQAAQLEQMQQFYRFAELGHLSTALFHDLANHLMSVSIDIEGLQQGQQSDILARIQDNVRYIDGVVKRVRQQIQGQSAVERFRVVDEIREIINILAYFSNQRQVSIDLQVASKDRSLLYRGDLTRFRQIIINLLSNAIEAYPESRGHQPRTVEVVVTRVDGLTISATDHGKGIRPAVQAKLFEPFYSTKDQGLGIGLFIVKKVVKEDFHGTISVSSNKQTGTTFVINLPMNGRRRG